MDCLKSCLIAVLMSFVVTSHGYGDVSERQSFEVGHVGNEVPLALLEKIALNEAQSIWGTVTAGPAIPVCDIYGDIVAYDVVFALGQKTFPKDEEIVRNVLAAKSICKQDHAKKVLSGEYAAARKERWGIDEYGTVTVGARTDLFPILECCSGLPRYYTALSESREVAAKALNTNAPVLKRIIALDMTGKWFEFRKGEKSVYVNVFSRETTDESFINSFKKNDYQVTRNNAKNELQETWKMQVDALSGNSSRDLAKTASTTEVRLDGVPYYDWSYGCSPTAAAMVLGYWSNHGYSKLVDFYFSRVDFLQHGIYEIDDHVPNVQKELAIAMPTSPSGATYKYDVAPGIVTVANTMNGYNFSVATSNTGEYGGSGTDNPHWTLISTEIDAGRPVIWSLFGYPGVGDHSVAVVGYKRVSKSTWPYDRRWYYAIVHDTWDEQDHYWLIMKRSQYTGMYYSSYDYKDICVTVDPASTPAVDWDVDRNTIPYSWTVDENVTIKDNLNAVGDLLVTNGATLAIDSEKKITFASAQESENYGNDASRCELVISGGGKLALAWNDTLTSSGTWGGVLCTGAGCDGTVIFGDECSISNAKYGIYLDGITCTVGSSPDGGELYISHCDSAGIRTVNSSPQISNVTITGPSARNSLVGVSVSGGSPILNDITASNCLSGTVRVSGGATISSPIQNVTGTILGNLRPYGDSGIYLSGGSHISAIKNVNLQYGCISITGVSSADTIRNVTISYPYSTGIYVSGGSVSLIRDVSITGGSRGVSISGVSPVMENISVNSGNSDGITVANGMATMDSINVYIPNLSGSCMPTNGILVSGSSSVIIHDSEIYNVNEKGVYVGAPAHLNIYSSIIRAMYPFVGDSAAVLEMNSGLDCDPSGYNSIIRIPNEYDEYGVDISGFKGMGYIQSIYNYWGSANPTPTYDKLVSILYEPYLTEPDPYVGLAKVVSLSGNKASFGAAYQLERAGNSSDAIAMYWQLFAGASDHQQKCNALLSLMRVADRGEKDYSEIQGLVIADLAKKTTTDAYRKRLDLISCELDLRAGKTDKAISGFLAASEKYAGTGTEVDMLARVAEVYGAYLENTATAKEYADKAAALNPSAESLYWAYLAAGIQYNPTEYKDVATQDSSKGEPEKAVKTAVDYVNVAPNPGNPSTTITYSLTNAGNVKLVVYAANGQKVATLANGPVSAGAHSVRLDGSKLASGIYFYRFESPGMTKTGKMMLLK